MTTLFVSDLHLSILRPEKLALFMRLMTGPAIKADAFYILGDLFDDFWIGCDDDHPPNQEVMSILREYSANSATQLFIMRGNRDFHLNQEFANATGCILIASRPCLMCPIIRRWSRVYITPGPMQTPISPGFRISIRPCAPSVSMSFSVAIASPAATVWETPTD